MIFDKLMTFRHKERDKYLPLTVAQ